MPASLCFGLQSQCQSGCVVTGLPLQMLFNTTVSWFAPLPNGYNERTRLSGLVPYVKFFKESVAVCVYVHVPPP